MQPGVILGIFCLLILLLISVGIAIFWYSIRAGRLKRNIWIGIRTPGTLKSDEAWVAGHLSGVRVLLYTLPLNLLAALVVLWQITCQPNDLGILGIGFVVWIVLFLGIVVYSAVRANAAAHASVGGENDNPSKSKGGFSGPIVGLAIVGILAVAITSIRVNAGLNSSAHSDVRGVETNSVGTYSTRDIFEYITFSSGPIAREHPRLQLGMKFTNVLDDVKRNEILDSMVGCINAIEPNFESSFTSNFQSGDPYRVESALKVMDATATKLLNTKKAAPPCPEPPSPPQKPAGTGSGFWHTNLVVYTSGYVVLWALGALWTTVAAGISLALAAAVTAVVFVGFFVAVAAVVVPILITYQFERRDFTGIEHDQVVARIAAEFRSVRETK